MQKHTHTQKNIQTIDTSLGKSLTKVDLTELLRIYKQIQQGGKEGNFQNTQ